MQANLRSAHRKIWIVLAVLLIAGFIAALAGRQERPIDTTPLPGVSELEQRVVA